MSPIETGGTSLRKGDRKIVRVESIAVGGEGVSKDCGIPIFIDRVAPGDQVEVEIFDVRKTFARGQVEKIIEPSQQRTQPPCSLFKVCGGCQLQHLGYEHQLEAKHLIVRQAIKHIGGLSEDLVCFPIGAKNDLHYRNKVQFPVKHPHRSKRILAGYYKQDSHELVNIKHCPVQPQLLDRVLETAKELCEQNHISAYDEKTHTGILRHITMRYSWDRKQALVTFVINCFPHDFDPQSTKALPERFQRVATTMIERVPEVVGVCLNFNITPGNRIMGAKTICLAGDDYLEEILRTDRGDLPEKLRAGITYRLSPTSFFQVNTEQATRLFEEVYDAVTEHATVKPKLIVDAYAGVGAMALWLAAGGEEVIAIEELASAVEDGLKNIELNGIPNVRFRQATVESAFAEMRDEGLVPDVVILDPPRRGLTEEAIDALVKLAPAKIVYVSCNPATLARDLKILQSGEGANGQEDVHKSRAVGYKTNKIQPIDMFPHTQHIESFTVLERL